jgi:hypothetical protein
MLKFIGARFGRTGTLSMKCALERLGYAKCYQMLDFISQPEQVRYCEAAALVEPFDWQGLFSNRFKNQQYAL